MGSRAAISLAAVAGLVLCFALPRSPGASGASMLRVTDLTGKEVALPSAAQRVISLAPHATEMLFAAGAGAQVVGVLPPADSPAEAKHLAQVGANGVLDLERIVALKPDLIIAWPYAAPAQTERLRALGIPIYESNPRVPEDIAVDMERIGILTGHASSAALQSWSFRSRLDALKSHRDKPRVRVFYEIWPSPLYTLGGGHWVSSALALCGADNVFAASTLPAPVVTVESVLQARPDAVIAGTDGGVRPPWLDEWLKWRELPAAVDRNLWVVDANLLHRAGPRFVEGAETLCTVIDGVRQRRSSPRAASMSRSR